MAAVMREIETDYLVVGAGTTGMAFVDALAAASEAEVVMVDRRYRPGGHWIDAYPFVRLHQPSAFYGVNSRVLGADRIDETGINAGWYERSTAAEICDYFNRVLEDHLLPTGRVRFFGMSDYIGESSDGHRFVSRLDGQATTVKVRKTLVDATYVESEIPSKHTPSFVVEDGVRLIPPNDLIDLQEPASSGFTVIGAGKTAMDTCGWLLEQGVDPGSIRWIKPRDAWFFNRAFTQPLELVGSYMQLQARWVQAAEEAEDGLEFARRLEAAEVFMRVDPSVEPSAFRGATLSTAEIDSLREIENVVRLGRVLRIGTDRIELRQDSIVTDPGQVYVDCTAVGVRPTRPRPVFEAGRITLQYVTPGVVPWSAATQGAIEALREDNTEKNRLTPPVVFTGHASDLLGFAYASMSGLTARGAEPDLAAWSEAARLNPTRGAAQHMDDPRVLDAFTTLGAHIGPALENLARLVGEPSASAV